MLYVPTIYHNLIPSFILRQADDIILKDLPKIHCQHPTKEGHCLLHHNINISIMLNLDGLFSVLDIRKLIINHFIHGVCISITPEGTTWNPYDLVYLMIEEVMVDIDGVYFPQNILISI